MNCRNTNFNILLFGLFFCFIYSGSLFSQKANPPRTLQKANYCYDKKKFDAALPLYLELEKIQQPGLIEEEDLMYKIAFCYYSSDLEKEKSIPYFLRFLSVSKTVYE